jgi:hypothetical protein
MTTVAQPRTLVNELLNLWVRSRQVFRQERSYYRGLALGLAEVMAFAQHTVSQLIWGLGEPERDWSAWYRFFSRGRFRAEVARQVLLEESLQHVDPEGCCVVGVDGFQVPRSGQRIEGVSWQRCPRTPAWKRGIHLAQRFLNLSWLTPVEGGYCRAIPIWIGTAFTAKARLTRAVARTEWGAALEAVQWMRAELDRLGRAHQQLLVLADGAFDVLDFWRGLDDWTTALVRTARNRCLHHLPPLQAHKNRKYGERAPTPETWLALTAGWHRSEPLIRGHARRMLFRVEGPFLRQRAPGVPLFLIIVKGQTWWRDHRRRQRKPAFYLVNARPGDPALPLPIDTLLAAAWQRWELEVAHRELKTTFGLGDKQCWNPLSAVATVQWSAWLYGLLLLAAYRTWGLLNGPRPQSAWWSGAPRWSFNTLWRSLRASLTRSRHFRPLRRLSPDEWLEKSALSDLAWNFAHFSLST